MKLDFKCPEKNRIRNIICLKKTMNAADYMALTHQLLSPKLYVEGVIAYGKENLRKTSEFIRSLHLEQEVKVIPGSPTVYTGHKGELSEGTRFLIECAEKEDERILNVCVYGALTEVAYAYQEAPDIMKKVTVIWCGGNAWPLGGGESRIAENVEAAKKSVQFTDGSVSDSGKYLQTDKSNSGRSTGQAEKMWRNREKICPENRRRM